MVNLTDSSLGHSDIGEKTQAKPTGQWIDRIIPT